MVGLLVLASCCWLAVMPAEPDAASLDYTADATPTDSATIVTPTVHLIPPTDRSTDEPEASPPAAPASSVSAEVASPSPASAPAAAAVALEPAAPPPTTTATLDTPATIIQPLLVVEPAASSPAPEPAVAAATPKIEQPTQPVEPIKTPEPAAAAPVQSEPAAPIVAPTPATEVKQPEATPLPPTPTLAPVAPVEPRPAVATLPSSINAADAAPNERSGKLNSADLDDAALRCAAPATQQCDWSWGQFSRSPNSEDHPPDDLNIDTRWKKPQDFYSFQAGLHVSGEGTGVIVRIHMKDLCCTGPLPLSYFEITAHGAAQATSNPPLALGPMPIALGRGHQPVLISRRGWGRDIDLSSSVDETRVLQTFLLLPDPGIYSIEVVLLHYNSSVDMISEVFPHRSKLYEQRGGLWTNRNLRNARGQIGTKLTIPAAVTAELRTDRSTLPLCGAEGFGKLGGFSSLGARYGFPLVGRWIFEPPAEPDLSVGFPPDPLPGAVATDEIDYTNLPRRWLVERSVFVPYFCRLETSAPDLIPRALERAVWTHFTGDSNTRHLMHTTCTLANGTLQLPSKAIPKMYDPPHSCIGPSSPDNRPDSETGIAIGSNARWIITYTNWFWGKEQTLSSSFNFGDQCAQYTEELVWSFHGWPSCAMMSPRFQSMAGPGFTYSAWGSHPMEWGYSSATAEFFLSQEAFGLDYYKHHPTLFALTTSTTPQKISELKALSRRMRNNERLQAMNMQIVDAVMHQREQYATRAAGGAAHSWIPVFDFFSPTHAAHEALSGDSVHFGLFLIRHASKWLAHYMLNAPNFGPPATTTAVAEAAQPVVA